MHTCPNCGKDVEGNIAEPCPKCGFDPMAAAGGSSPTPEVPPAPEPSGAPDPASEDPPPSIRLRIPRATTTGGTVPAPSAKGWILRWPWRRQGS